MQQDPGSAASVGEQHLLAALATTLTAGRRRLEDLLALVEDVRADEPVRTTPGDAEDAAQLSRS